MQQNETKTIWQVIAASSVGTLIEWYDFYIFGSLAPVLAAQFFPKTNPTAALLSTLATFAAGFIVRPFGALVFGRLGDLIGRKYTFLLTLIIMGGSTFAIGLIPGYETIGFAAPVLVLLLRLLQGLALGGEYGGAATYVAEHSPTNRRGYYTSWIQTTATLGLFVSLGVILITRHSLDADLTKSIAKFNQWGWRIPFLVSIILVIISIYIRLRMKESPLFAKLKTEGKTSVNPLKESFVHKGNLKMVLLALFGATMGQGVVWYTGQFYAQSFIENVCKVDFDQSRTIIIWAILFATPFFVVFGRWSDKIGRKWIMMIGMLLAIVSYRPVFNYFIHLTDVKELVRSLPKQMPGLNINSQESKDFEKQWDDFFAKGNKADLIIIKNDTIEKEQKIISQYKYRWILKDEIQFSELRTDTVINYKSNPEFRYNKNVTYIDKRLTTSKYWKIVAFVWVLIIFVTMVYGPIAAFLVEMFPTKIRYTSMSLPYHVGNGVFGGLTPFIATLLTTIYTGDKLVGLWYPVLVAAVCLVIGVLYISNKIDPDVND
ncbi:MAG: MFS transporter [Sphingobacteriales bacterium]|nr:MFS transporter [Sphingobacteriales bacterium]MBI3718882.1 MFS transporter [Sphingobacteriales bacterium]